MWMERSAHAHGARHRQENVLHSAALRPLKKCSPVPAGFQAQLDY
jgi:hypothetical protein